MRFNLGGIGVELQAKTGHEALGKTRPVDRRIGHRVRVVVADRTVDFSGHADAAQLRHLTVDAGQYVGHFLTECGRRCGLAVCTRQHRLAGVGMAEHQQGILKASKCPQQHGIPALLQHQAVTQVVDIFRGAGEVGELLGLRQIRTAFQFFLDEILDGFDIVVGGALDGFDLLGIGKAEISGDGAKKSGLGLIEFLKFGNTGFGGKGDQPFDFHMHPGFDQTELGKHRPQGIDFAGIAAIGRRKGEEGMLGHDR